MEKSEFQITNGKLIKYTGSAESVIVPDGVLTIVAFAFPETVKSVVVPESVAWVKKFAFSNCKLTNWCLDAKEPTSLEQTLTSLLLKQPLRNLI